MNSQEILDALEFDTLCDVGKENGYGHGRMTPCARPAAWAVHYHDCPSREDTTPKTGAWCDHHLNLFKLSVETQIKDSSNGRVGCTTCRRIYTSSADFVWGATPINTRHNTNKETP